jgi:hypothetical protein
LNRDIGDVSSGGSEEEESSGQETSDSDANENEDFPDFKPNGYHPVHIG